MVAGLEGLEPHYDFVIVGAGLSGFVFAEQAAARFGYTSLIIDKRDHIGAFPPGCAQLRLDMTRAKHDRVACALAGVRPCGGGTGGRKEPTLQVWGRVAEPLLALTPPPPVHHAGGNCFDFIDSHGIRVSQYGVHLFHTQARPHTCSTCGVVCQQRRTQPPHASALTRPRWSPPLSCRASGCGSMSTGGASGCRTSTGAYVSSSLVPTPGTSSAHSVLGGARLHAIRLAPERGADPERGLPAV